MSYLRSQILNPGESEEPLCMLLLPLGPRLLKPWKLVLVWLGIPGDLGHATSLSLRATVGISTGRARRPS